MPTVYFITHPDVVIDPAVPVPDWALSARGRTRMALVLRQDWAGTVRSVWCSTEQKARDGAAILAAGLGLPVCERAGLGENDRSATGYLPRAEFEAVADAFFAAPEASVRGWERAADAQRRIVSAVDEVLGEAPPGDVAIVSHGGVGALLLCHLSACPIGRERDQPGESGGNYLALDRTTRAVLHSWRPID